jgi:uncharacterized phiE125 gp8 family phage protein
MTIVVYSGPAIEPVTVTEAKAACRLDQSNQELAPGAPTVALASPAVAGNVNAGAHRYRVTFTTADGETEGGTVSSSVTVADASINGKVELTAIPLGGSLVTSRKIYRTAAAGTTYLLLATLADNTTTVYTDNIADSSLGAGAPSANTTSDPELVALIKSARQQAETELHRYLITQTLDAYFDTWPACDGKHKIVLPPLQSVTSITYLDANGDTQTLAADQYVVDAKSQPARITPAYGVSWPSLREQTNAVTVRFVAGYGAAASSVPQCVRNWMLCKIANEHPGVKQPMPEYVDRNLDSERVWARA